MSDRRPPPSAIHGYLAELLRQAHIDELIAAQEIIGAELDRRQVRELPEHVKRMAH